MHKIIWILYWGSYNLTHVYLVKSMFYKILIYGNLATEFSILNTLGENLGK